MKTHAHWTRKGKFFTKTKTVPLWVRQLADSIVRTANLTGGMRAIGISECGKGFRCFSNQRVVLSRATAVATLTTAASAFAQPVFVTPPAIPPAPVVAPATSSDSEGEDGGALGFLGESFAPGLPFAWRNLVFRPSVAYEFKYGNGILSSTNRERTTIVQTVSPGLLVQIGDQWSLTYSPSITLYSDSEFEDGVDHSANLNGNTTYEDWTFGLTASASKTSQPETETAEQTEQQNYGGSLSAVRILNANLSMDVRASVSARLTEKLNNSRTYSLMSWLNQQLTDDFGVGLGLGGGFNDVSLGTDMPYEEVRGRINWHCTEKLNLSLNGGVEIRQYLDSNSTEMLPVYGASLTYTPVQPTSLTLNASRSVGASLFRDQITETSSVSVTLNQRLLQKLNLGLTASYGLNTYSQTTGQLATVREDTHTTYSARLSTSFFRRGSASLFYSIGDNDSDREAFTYTSHQTGFEISWRY